MAITRYSRMPSLSPWRGLDELTNRLNQLFDESTEGTPVPATWFPPVNVEETANELVLTAELPGMSHEDVEIELENNVLTIRGEKQEERREEDGERRRHLWERRYGSFQRSFTLPRTVKADEISARVKDGVLHVHLPKVPEAKGRKIQIRTEG